MARQIGESFKFPPGQPVQAPEIQTVSLEELICFLADPIGSFERTILGANPGRIRESDLPDEEPFDISSLDRYLFVEELLKNPDSGNFWEQAYRSGKLPYNPIPARQEVEDLQAVLQKKLEKLEVGPLLPAEPVRISVGGFEIEGSLTGLRRNGFQVFARPAKARLQDRIRLAVYHLATEGTYRTYGLFSDKSLKAGALADVSFAEILDLYQTGRKRPIYFSEEENETAAFLGGTTPKDFRLQRHFGAVPDSESIEAARMLNELVGKIKQGVSDERI